ncbi:MAG: hypothetical protein LBI84_10310, partial [Propionibacteriaceae bacterium]|nr:hypothetical protein [Propionibacteriaceae bacterium]
MPIDSAAAPARALAAAPRRGRRRIAVAGAAVVLAAVVAGMIRLLWSDTPAQLPEPRCQAVIEDGSTASIDIEQSENASLIAGVAAQRGLIPRAVSIALATAFQESKIRNLDYGDLDSLGLFQQRPSAGWGTPEEILDPYYSTNMFYDAMERVDGWQSADIGDVAQEVQRSAFPDAYDQHIARARILASALSGETPAAWSCVVHSAATADPVGLAEAAKQAYGSEITAFESTPADPDGKAAKLQFDGTTEQAAWSAAAFAQSWAAAKGVQSVQVGDRLWTAAADGYAP